MKDIYNKICILLKIGKREDEVKQRIWTDRDNNQHIIFGDISDEYAEIILYSFYQGGDLCLVRTRQSHEFQLKHKLPLVFSVVTIASIIAEEGGVNECTCMHVACTLSELIALINNYR